LLDNNTPKQVFLNMVGDAESYAQFQCSKGKLDNTKLP